ncbi:hypothetical protein ABT052_28840 [Streptomyces sp. NPDC002766]|uniref:hypothetical protein n=1 Tax=Streptomyces sp. NPDC002766 TaxID=3154429 RepID=UPI00331BAE74
MPHHIHHTWKKIPTPALNTPCYCCASGCVLTPGRGKSFGFGRFVEWSVGALGVATLVLLYCLGHETEVLIGVAAAFVVAAVVETCHMIGGQEHGR